MSVMGSGHLPSVPSPIHSFPLLGLRPLPSRAPPPSLSLLPSPLPLPPLPYQLSRIDTDRPYKKSVSVSKRIPIHEKPPLMNASRPSAYSYLSGPPSPSSPSCSSSHLRLHLHPHHRPHPSFSSPRALLEHASPRSPDKHRPALPARAHAHTSIRGHARSRS